MAKRTIVTILMDPDRTSTPISSDFNTLGLDFSKQVSFQSYGNALTATPRNANTTRDEQQIIVAPLQIPMEKSVIDAPHNHPSCERP